MDCHSDTLDAYRRLNDNARRSDLVLDCGSKQPKKQRKKSKEKKPLAATPVAEPEPEPQAGRRHRQSVKEDTLSPDGYEKVYVYSTHPHAEYERKHRLGRCCHCH